MFNIHVEIYFIENNNASRLLQILSFSLVSTTALFMKWKIFDFVLYVNSRKIPAAAMPNSEPKRFLPLSPRKQQLSNKAKTFQCPSCCSKYDFHCKYRELCVIRFWGYVCKLSVSVAQFACFLLMIHFKTDSIYLV